MGPRNFVVATMCPACSGKGLVLATLASQRGQDVPGTGDAPKPFDADDASMLASDVRDARVQGLRG